MTPNLPTQPNLPVVKGKTFAQQLVVLDGISYEECIFDHCTIQYSGGAGQMLSCVFIPDNLWDFRGAAGQVIQTLQLSGWVLEFGKPSSRSARGSETTGSQTPSSS